MAGDQPLTFEPLSGSQPFQNGGDACSEGPLTKGRLDDKDISHGCLFLDPHSPTTPEVSTVQTAKEIVSVHVSLLG